TDLDHWRQHAGAIAARGSVCAFEFTGGWRIAQTVAARRAVRAGKPPRTERAARRPTGAAVEIKPTKGRATGPSALERKVKTVMELVVALVFFPITHRQAAVARLSRSSNRFAGVKG